MLNILFWTLFAAGWVWAILGTIWNIKVKTKCKCGAAAGRWFRLYDEPVRFGARWYASRSTPRRWNDSDFVKFSNLSRGGSRERKTLHNNTRR